MKEYEEEVRMDGRKKERRQMEKQEKKNWQIGKWKKNKLIIINSIDFSELSV